MNRPIRSNAESRSTTRAFEGCIIMHPMQNAKHEYRARAEALECVRARELKQMSEEEALRRIMSLCVSEPPWRERPDWSGLIEQQAIFHGRSRR